jgi:hypothetical protein
MMSTIIINFKQKKKFIIKGEIQFVNPRGLMKESGKSNGFQICKWMNELKCMKIFKIW